MTTVCLRGGGTATSQQWAASGESSSDEALFRRIAALSARRRRTDAELDEPTVATVPDIADDPEITLQKKDRDEALRQSLHRLSLEHREVIDLAYYHSKSVREIAEIVGINEATVKTRMFYARRKLVELVETT